MKKAVTLAAVILVLLTISLWHQSSRRDTHARKIFVMDTFVELLAEGTREQAEAAFKDAASELDRLDSRLGYRDSLVDELNSRHVVRDPEIYRLVKVSREVHDASERGFSITLRPILDAWGFSGLHPYRMPTADEFENWKRLPQDEAIRLVPDGITVETPENIRIDLGGIAKGYAADRAAKAMQRAGAAAGLVNAGGDIACFGERTWNIGVKHPKGPGVFAVVPLKDRAMATSGDYERFFVHEGERYHHILDPASGMPARGLISATVIADTCTEADAWATALFVRGPGRLAAELERRGMEWIVVDAEGMVTASPALKDLCPEKLPER
ncbi:MAG: FAD:protein FMN transferase [Desulfomonilia bacterium]|jgi:thiamine biosynthesis lipoprotein